MVHGGAISSLRSCKCQTFLVPIISPTAVSEMEMLFTDMMGRALPVTSWSGVKDTEWGRGRTCAVIRLPQAQPSCSESGAGMAFLSPEGRNPRTKPWKQAAVSHCTQAAFGRVSDLERSFTQGQDPIGVQLRYIGE